MFYEMIDTWGSGEFTLVLDSRRPAHGARRDNSYHLTGHLLCGEHFTVISSIMTMLSPHAVDHIICICQTRERRLRGVE